MTTEKLEMVQSMIDATARRQLIWHRQAEHAKPHTFTTTYDENKFFFIEHPTNDFGSVYSLERLDGPEGKFPIEMIAQDSSRIAFDKMSSLSLAIHESLGLK